MQLSKQAIQEIKPQAGLTVPDAKMFDLPERVLQFGTGVLLRGLPDYFIDKANRQGIFNGRVVVVKSTSAGSADEFTKQDALYSICVRGIEDGHKVEEVIINSSISRVLSANDEWESILFCAHNPDLQIIISNTTEVGITLVEDDVRLFPPRSFPGKLLAFLLQRYKYFKGASDKGMVIVPTELITDNGTKLRSIILELAEMNKLDAGFIQWLSTANHFCNSLVDRIVPGKLPANDSIATQAKLGYKDELMIMAECFRLWAIESDSEKVKKILSFTQADDGAVIAPDIEKFRELKLRLLNGTHTFSCALAHLAGFSTVREAMSNEFMSSFINNLAIHEIARAVSNDTISYTDACEFASKVFDRFRNPFLDHQWQSISVQYSSKMRMRNVPLLVRHYEKTKQVPEHMALGFAAYLLFMKSTKDPLGIYKGISNGKEYSIQDDLVDRIAGKWQDYNEDQFVDKVLADQEIWGMDLTSLFGFAEAVKTNLRSLVKNGIMPTLRRVQLHKTIV
jgi:tagaturonate reductase